MNVVEDAFEQIVERFFRQSRLLLRHRRWCGRALTFTLPLDPSWTRVATIV